MRVLLLHNRYRQLGGEDAVVDSEINLLRSRGVEVLHLDAHNEVDSRVELQGAFGLALNSHWSRESYEGVRKICREFRPDVAHAHNLWMRLTPAVHAACRDEGVATVQTLHNFRLFCTNAQFQRDGHRCEDCLGRSPWRGVIRRCYRNSFIASAAVARMITTNRVRKTWDERVNAFIALSHHARKLYIAGGIPASRIHIKANFVEDRGASRTAPSRSREFVFVGRLAEQKGLVSLLNAWAITGLGNEARLLIVGDGPERSALEALADKLGIAQQVSFAGYQTQSKVHAYLSGARAMIIPSLFYECFPRTLVEAMSAGRPIIASNVNSLNELVTGDFGLQFAAGNIDELATSIRRLYDDKPFADRLGAASRSNYLARYTPERNFDALMQIYEVAMSRQEAWLGAEPIAVGGAG